MKRTLTGVTFFALALVALVLSAPGLSTAQDSPNVGTWKLNLAKSKFEGAAAPKEETRVVEAAGKGLKITFTGTAGDGSKINYSVTTALDGKPAPVTGVGATGGSDMYAITRVDANTYTTAGTKGGQAVFTSRTVVSKDGKVTTITRKGPGAANVVTVWDKQ